MEKELFDALWLMVNAFEGDSCSGDGKQKALYIAKKQVYNYMAKKTEEFIEQSEERKREIYGEDFLVRTKGWTTKEIVQEATRLRNLNKTSSKS